MPDALIYWTLKTMAKTRTTTRRSGASTEGFNERCEKLCGEMDAAGFLDELEPYLSICAELSRLLSRKRGYYGCKEHPLQNALGVEEDGISPVKYQVARVGEKCRRLRGALGTIDIRKTLLDIAGHAVVAIACLDHEVANEPEDS